MDRLEANEVTTTFYLYDCEVSELCMEAELQLMFVELRLHRVQTLIGKLLTPNYKIRDYERLRACYKAEAWCNKMIREINE